MAARAVTLRLPEPLYDHFSRRAERAHRSLEAELLDAVAGLAADEKELSQEVAQAIADLKLLTVEELWRAARNRLPDTVRARLAALNSKQQREKLTSAEKEELGQLVHQYDWAVLMRAEAARLLKERGHDVSRLLTAL